MKKNIRLIPIDPSFEEWLLKQLLQDPPESRCCEELFSALQEMLQGEVSSLLLSNTTETIPIVNDVIKVGEMEIYPKNRRVIMQKKEVTLTPKEFDILYFLAENRGEVFTKEQIYRAVWSNDYLLDDSNIMAFIRKLRKKIEPDPDAPLYILTIWGIGYKFNDQL